VTSTCPHDVLYGYIGSVSDRPVLSVRRCVSRKILTLRRISGFHTGGYEEHYPLRYEVM
jgi:hypothetical protein